MSEMRPDFADIVRGWTLRDDFDDLFDRLARLDQLVGRTGGEAAMNEHELATVKFMIQACFVRGMREGLSILDIIFRSHEAAEQGKP